MDITIGTREQWLTARKELLAREKALTRRNDELARERRELPWRTPKGRDEGAVPGWPRRHDEYA